MLNALFYEIRLNETRILRPKRKSDFRWFMKLLFDEVLYRHKILHYILSFEKYFKCKTTSLKLYLPQVTTDR